MKEYTIHSFIEKYGSFLRFCIVGGLATLIDACIYYLVKPFVNYQVAMVTGYMLSLVVNYLLTVFWTFKSKPTIKNGLGVLAAHLINCFIIRAGLLFLFVKEMRINDNIAYIIMLCISIPLNFLMVKFVFTQKKRIK